MQNYIQTYMHDYVRCNLDSSAEVDIEHGFSNFMNYQFAKTNNTCEWRSLTYV